jgi:hypothetical protein
MITDEEFRTRETTEMAQGMVKSLAKTLLERYEHWSAEREKMAGG